MTAAVIGHTPLPTPNATTPKNTATIIVTLVARPSRPSVKLTPFTVPITARNMTGIVKNPKSNVTPGKNGTIISMEIPENLYM